MTEEAREQETKFTEQIWDWRNTVIDKVLGLFPRRTAEHLVNAEKEAMLAVRSLLDQGIEALDSDLDGSRNDLPPIATPCLNNAKKKMPKVGFVSLGCPKNLVDSEVMLGTLAGQGYSITPRKEDADVIVVNTCGFIDSAKKESIDTILEMADLKLTATARNSSLPAVSRNGIGPKSRRKFPEIDFIFGPDELGRILEAVQLDSSVTVPDVSIDALYTSKEVPTIPRILTTPSYMAYLEDLRRLRSCLYVLRDSGISRTLPQPHRPGSCRRIEAACRSGRARTGYRFAGHDGLRQGHRHTNGITALLRELVALMDLQWVRFLYCYPNMVSDEFVRLGCGRRTALQILRYSLSACEPRDSGPDAARRQSRNL